MNILKTFNKQLLVGVIAGVAVTGIITAVAYFSITKSAWLPIKEIEARSVEFVNAELLQGKGSATVKVVGKEADMYKLEVNYNGQKIDSFISKDGKKFYPQAYDLVENENAQSDSISAVNEVAQKSDKPIVELFVMSHCPYGTQIEKGIIPVLETLGDKIDFQLKFVNYAMHGEKELKEQLSQYCIQKEQPTKLITYLECFLKDGDSGVENCLSQSGVDKGKLESCITKTDKEYKVSENFNNTIGFKGSYPGFEIFKSDNEKYSVAGSPTLIINGAQSQSGRDSKSLLKSICSAFTNPPKECSSELSGDAPSPGFGTASAPAGSANSGGCQ